MAGGKSTAEMVVVDGGAEGSAKSLAIRGTISDAFKQAWAGAMFSPGKQIFQPANLGAKKEVRFWAKGDGKTYRVFIFAESKGFAPLTQTFVAGAEWKEYVFPLSSFDGIDGHDIMALIFGGGPAPGTLRVPDRSCRVPIQAQIALSLAVISLTTSLGWTKYVWLIFLPAFFVEPVLHRASARCGRRTSRRAAIFVATYFRGHWVGGHALVAESCWCRSRSASVFSPVNPGAYVFFTYAASFAARFERSSDAAAWIAAITAIGLVVAFEIHAPLYFWLSHGVFTPLIGAVNSALCAGRARERRSSTRRTQRSSISPPSPSASASRAICTTCSGTRCR